MTLGTLFTNGDGVLRLAPGDVFLTVSQDDTLIPISMHPTPTALSPHPQPLQTNQTTFTHSSQPQTLLVTTGDGSVKLLDYPSLTTVHALHAHTSACFCLELAPTGRYLAVGGSDALISLWDTTEWVCRRTLAGMVGAVKQVSFSWDGSYVVGGSDEGNGLEIVSILSPNVAQ
jgi:THO complex subunit 3